MEADAVFTSDNHSLGFVKFLELEKLELPSNHFVKNGSVTFEARLAIYSPCAAMVNVGSFAMPKSGIALLLECPICLDRYKGPKLLSCGHTFCQDCLQVLCAVQEITCPMCRAKTSCQQGVDALPNDLKACAILDGLEHRFACCSACSKASAVVCLICRMNFCKPCLPKHSQATGADMHTVVETGHIIICQRHDSLSTHVCADCKLYICPHCFIGPCMNHNYKEVGCAVKTFMGQNTGTLQCLAHFFQDIRQDQSKIFEQAKVKLVKESDNIIEQVNKKRMELEAELSSLEHKALSKIRAEEDALSSSYGMFINATAECLKEGVPQGMLQALNTSMAGVVPEGSFVRVTFAPTDDFNIGKFQTEQETRDSTVVTGIEEIFRYKLGSSRTPRPGSV